MWRDEMGVKPRSVIRDRGGKYPASSGRFGNRRAYQTF